MIPIRQNLVPSSKYSIKCPNSMTAQYITVHNTANDASANNEISYMIGNDNQVSYHLAVDDAEVVQGVPFDRNAWHCGDGNGDGNRKSIGIEICYSKSGGAKYEKAEALTVKLVAQLLKERGWGIERVKKHQDWSGKYCPHRILDGGRWQSFLEAVKASMGDTTTKTPIMGGALLNAACLASYLLKTNPTPKINCTVLELAQHYISEGQAEGVRGDVAFCQAIHETGWFRYGGDVLPEQNNFCGLGATNTTPTGKGAWFDTPQLGVRAQVQHLKAYASKDALKNACIDPRFGLVPRGIAANWEDLAGRWAVPGYDSKKYSGIEAARVAGETYGQKILAVFLNAVKTKPEGEGQTITLVIGGDVLSVPAENVEGRWTVTMPNGVKVVLRDILTVLGYTSITWEESTKTIIATK